MLSGKLLSFVSIYGFADFQFQNEIGTTSEDVCVCNMLNGRGLPHCAVNGDSMCVGCVCVGGS